MTKSQTKIIVSGRVNVMCFDKTGTLTEDSLDLYGVKTIIREDNGRLRFKETVRDNYCTKLNSNEDSGNKKGVSHHMLELMATCHSLAYIKQNLSGYLLTMFYSTL